MSRISLIEEEIREVAVQSVFVSSQDEVECLGSCFSDQGHEERAVYEGRTH